MSSNACKHGAAMVLALMILIASGSIKGSRVAADSRDNRDSDRVYGQRGYGGGYWEQKGYRDGLDRGREDARSHRRPDPNNSEHFRNGNGAYRAGFARGYRVGYGQYRGYGYGRRY